MYHSKNKNQQQPLTLKQKTNLANKTNQCYASKAWPKRPWPKRPRPFRPCLASEASLAKKPLILFVNLLMKHGKKNHALRVMSTTLSLFKDRISKNLFLGNVNPSKPCSQSFYQYYFPRFYAPWPSARLSFFSSSYSIKAKSKSVVFSSDYLLKTRSKSKTLSNRRIPRYVKYRNLKPFISNERQEFFIDFYKRKRFFCGRFITLFCFKFKISVLYKPPIYIKQNHIAFKNRSTSSKSLPVSKKCFWYKRKAKKPCWDKLTNAQKNTFLYCLHKAISNVKPPLECRTKRIGGSNKQIPSQVSEHRQWGIAIRWIIEAALCEFSKRTSQSKNKYQQSIRADSNNIQETFGLVQDKSNIPRGFSQNLIKHFSQNASFKQSHFGPWISEKNTEKLNSLLHKKKVVCLQSKQNMPKNFFPDNFCFFLAESLENAYYKKGPAMQKRNLWVETALANRAFLRFRWW